MNSEQKSLRINKRAAGIAILLSIVSLLLAFRHTSFLALAIEHETKWKHSVSSNPVIAALAIMIVYAIVTSLPIPIASLGSLVAGWLLGFWLGVPTISLGATLGASLTFWGTRVFFRESISAIGGKRLAAINRHLQQEGIFYVAVLRLIPGLPFFIVNTLLAQTRISFRAFFWASYVSMLPGTCLHIAAGAALPNLTKLRDEGIRSVVSWQLAIVLLLLAVQPLLLRVILRQFRKSARVNV